VEEASRLAKDLRVLWKNYVLQSLLATISIFIVLLFLSLQHAVVIASIGATTFIIFTMPNSIAAKPKNVIGGHLIGFVCGAISTLMPHTSFLITITIYSLAVGLSILIMVIMDLIHPPASGTALGTAITGFTYEALIAIIISTTLLSAIKHILKPYLKDLIR